MTTFNWFGNISKGIEFLIAVGSIVGLLGFILGIVFFLLGNSKMRMKMLGIIIVSIILINVCGLYTGTRYFRLY